MAIPFVLEIESGTGAAAAPGAEALASTAELPEKEALQAFRRAVNLDPGDPDYFYIFGSALAQLGRHKEAIAAYRDALRLSASDPSYHRALAISLWQLALYDEAAASFQRALEALPDDADAQNGLALSLLRLGQAKEAVALLRRALRGDRSRADLQANLGVALWLQGSQKDGERSMRDAVRASPAYAPYRRNLGLALVATGRQAEAAECFREILRRHPEDACAFMDLGDALYALGRNQEAATAYEEGSLLDPALAAAREGSREARQAILVERTLSELREEKGAPPSLGHLFWGGVFSAERALGGTPRRPGGFRGRGVESIVLFTLLALAGRASWVLLPPYVTLHRFRDDVKQVARAPVRDDAIVLDRLAHAAREHGLGDYLRDQDFQIEVHGQWRRVKCRYRIPVVFAPGVATALRFEIDVEEPFLVEPDPINF